MDSIELTVDEKIFIQTHLTQNVSKLLLQYARDSSVDIRKLAVQIAARQRIKDKLPHWFANPDVIFPATVSVEQSSSEQAARYKASVVAQLSPKPARLIDLTGGMGVDTSALAEVVAQVTYVERQPELVQLVAHNLPRLGVHNVQAIHAQSEQVLSELQAPVDWIYLDPARRDDRGGRVVRLADCEPNVVAWWPALLTKAKQVLLKTSPLIDIEATLRELPGISAVHVVAVQHEVKEVLFVAGREPVDSAEVQMTAVDLMADHTVALTYWRGDEQRTPVVFDAPGQYIYEPNAAVLKAGAFRLVAGRFGLRKLALHSHLYTSDEPVPDFPGRTFQLEAVCRSSRADLQAVLPGLQANLTVRNFPQSVEALRKQLRLKEGGNVYILATTLQNGDKRLLVTRKADSVTHNLKK